MYIVVLIKRHFIDQACVIFSGHIELNACLVMDLLSDNLCLVSATRIHGGVLGNQYLGSYFLGQSDLVCVIN